MLRKAKKQGGTVASSQSRSDDGETRSSMKVAGSIGTPTAGTGAGARLSAAPRPLPLPAGAAGGGGGPGGSGPATPTAGGTAVGATDRGGTRARPASAQNP